MGTISLQQPQLGIADTTEDVKVQNNFTVLQNVINGNIDATNLTAAAAQSAGLNVSGQTVKGSSVIATSQNTGSTTFTTLATPDQVTGIVLPANGLIAVWYQATWSSPSVAGAQAAIFLGANQVQAAASSGPTTTAALNTLGGSTNAPLYSTAVGLACVNNGPYAGDATTGQIVGIAPSQNSSQSIGGSSFGFTGAAAGPCYIFAAAGTYTVSVQFKAPTASSVTALNRRLYVEAVSFS